MTKTSDTGPVDARLADHPAPRALTRRALSRRKLLAGGAGLAGLALGSTGATALTMPGGEPTRPASVPPSLELMSDHGILKRILLIYAEAGRRIGATEAAPAPMIHSAARIIHEYIEGFHEGLEEAYVFPRLKRHDRLTGTVATLLVQHARGRRITADILAATTSDSRLTGAGRRKLSKAMSAFVHMYEVHEAREDTEVFPAFRAITPERTLSELGERFAAEQRQRFGRHALADLVERVAAIEDRLGIHDLAQFTPSPEVPDGIVSSNKPRHADRMEP